MATRKKLCARCKDDIAVERIHRSLANIVPETLEISAGSAGRVDIEISGGPLDEEVVLAVRRLDND